MDYNHTYAAILKATYLMDERTIQGYIPLIVNLINGQGVTFPQPDDQMIKALRPEGAAAGGDLTPAGFNYYLRGYSEGSHYNKLDNYDQLPANSLAIVPVNGIMTAQDQFCGPAGSYTKAEMVEAAKNSDKISAILIPGNSPGGMVEGTERLAQAVSDASKIKPVIYFARGTTGSAAYWVASGASHIMAESETTEIGSIGTQVTYLDLIPILESQGAKLHTVRATKSQDKNKEFEELRAGDYSNLIKHRLDPINEIFHNNVRAGRGNKMTAGSEDPMSGKVYLANQAKDLGLIDELGSYTDAINKAYEMAQLNTILHV